MKNEFYYEATKKKTGFGTRKSADDKENLADSFQLYSSILNAIKSNSYYQLWFSSD